VEELTVPQVGRLDDVIGVALMLLWLVLDAASDSGFSSTDGKTGSVLAFGVLVPMLGLGLNGFWASRHGAFDERSAPHGDTDDEADDQ